MKVNNITRIMALCIWCCFSFVMANDISQKPEVVKAAKIAEEKALMDQDRLDRLKAAKDADKTDLRMEQLTDSQIERILEKLESRGSNETRDCANASWAGDGMCDSGNNNAGCNWDGGDCCASTAGGGTQGDCYYGIYADGYLCDCQDPNASENAVPSTPLTATIYDSYGDGGSATLSITDGSGAEELYFLSGYTGFGTSFGIELVDGDYGWTFSNSEYWSSESSFDIVDADGNVLASAGGYGNGGFSDSGNFNVGGPPPVYGCTDDTACNYNAEATDDDQSCTYALAGFNCDGSCISETATIVTTELYVAGYGSEKEWNLNASDGTFIAGCPDGYCYDSYSGYNAESHCLEDDSYTLSMTDGYGDGWDGAYMTVYLGSISDGNVIADGYNNAPTGSETTYLYFSIGVTAPVYGCTDATACNYDADADTDDNSCWFANDGCSCDDGQGAEDLGCGCGNPAASNGFDCAGACDGDSYVISVTNVSYLSEVRYELVGVTGIVSPYYDGDQTVCLAQADGWELKMGDSYGDTWNGNQLSVTASDGTVIFGSDGPEDGCESECSADGWDTCNSTGSPDGEPCWLVGTFSTMPAVYGCTDATACNYDASADVDDNSCTYPENGFECDGSCSGNALSIYLDDSYGDGWDGSTLTFGDIVLGLTSNDGPCDNGATSSWSEDLGECITHNICVADGSYDVTVGGGSYEYEHTWTISDENGVILSGGDPYSGSIAVPVPESYCGDGTCDDDETCGSALDADVGCSADCGFCSWDAVIELTSAGVQDDYDDDGVIDYAVRSDWTALTDFDDCDALAADLTQDICGYYISSGYTCEELVGYGYDCSNVDNCGLCPVPDACQDAGGNSYWSGDGMCDDANNNEACGWDGGDCCCSTCDTTDFTNYDPWECGNAGDEAVPYDCQDPVALASDAQYECSSSPQQQCLDADGFDWVAGCDNWSYGECLPSGWLCDDYNDCSDGADEVGCPDPPASCMGVDTGTDGVQDFVIDSDGDGYVDNSVLCDYYMYYVSYFGYSCTQLDAAFGEGYNDDGSALDGWGTCANADSCGLCEDSYGDEPVEVAIGDACDFNYFGSIYPGFVDCSGDCQYNGWTGTPTGDGLGGGYQGDGYCDGVDEAYGVHLNCAEFGFDAGDCDAVASSGSKVIVDPIPFSHNAVPTHFGYNPEDENMMLISKVFGFDRVPVKGPAMGGTWTQLAERKLERGAQPKPTLINIATGEVTPGTPLNSDRYVQYTLAYSTDGSNWYYVNDLVFNNYTIYGFAQHQDTYWSVYGIDNDGAITAWSNTTSAQAGDCGPYQDCDGRCFAESYLSWVGDDSCDGSTAPYGYNFACDAWDCDDGDCADECGACEGSGAGFTCWDNSIVCSEEDCPAQCSAGDANDDGSINVTDIVTMVAYILGNTDAIGDCADVNGDGGINVTDIVGTVSIILGSDARTADATSAEIIKTADSAKLKADGFVGAVQMTLSHGDDFSIELTDDAMVADYKTTGDLTTLIIVTPGSEELFTAQGEFKVEEAVVANSSTTIDASIATPEVFGLSSAYPNPFNPTTSVALSLPNDSYVSITVYNVIGQTVATLADGYMTADVYSFSWDASSVPSGAYFIRAEAGNDVGVQKVMLLK